MGEVDGVLQRCRVAVVVLGRDHHEGVGGVDTVDAGRHARRPRLRDGGGQIDVHEVDDVDRYVGALAGVALPMMTAVCSGISCIT
jgi:hypothetical protein